MGIYGHSGGGFMSAAAVLQKPYNEFFKAAVASAGNHDNNIYNDNWSEQYHGMKEVAVAEQKKDGTAGTGTGTGAGATGGTGRQLVRQALDAGHEVTAVVRDPRRLPGRERAGLRIVVADITDPAALRPAVAGHDAALSAL